MYARPRTPPTWLCVSMLTSGFDVIFLFSLLRNLVATSSSQHLSVSTQTLLKTRMKMSSTPALSSDFPQGPRLVSIPNLHRVLGNLLKEREMEDVVQKLIASFLELWVRRAFFTPPYSNLLALCMLPILTLWLRKINTFNLFMTVHLFYSIF